MPTVGEQIRIARKRKGMTQDELAAIMHVTRTAVSRWENNSRIPDAEKLLELAQNLDYRFVLGEKIRKDNNLPGK